MKKPNKTLESAKKAYDCLLKAKNELRKAHANELRQPMSEKTPEELANLDYIESLLWKMVYCLDDVGYLIDDLETERK